jgi:hypothetical protein
MSKLSFSITANQATFVSHQIIGREDETATFLSRCLFNSELREFGFVPRQLNRYNDWRNLITHSIRPLSHFLSSILCGFGFLVWYRRAAG